MQFLLASLLSNLRQPRLLTPTVLYCGLSTVLHQAQLPASLSTAPPIWRSGVAASLPALSYLQQNCTSAIRWLFIHNIPPLQQFFPPCKKCLHQQGPLVAFLTHGTKFTYINKLFFDYSYTVIYNYKLRIMSKSGINIFLVLFTFF